MKPTWLMIKKHTLTNTFYLCKTTTNNPYKYLGSGKVWKRHIKKHGKQHVTTEYAELFYDQEILTELALFMSDELDVVKSTNWANLIPENGIDGAVNGTTHSNETKLKMSKSHKGKLNSKEHNKNISAAIKGIPKTGKNAKGIKISWNKGIPCTEEHKEKLRKPITPREIIICPHCSKSGDISLMKRWHLDNCKEK